MEEKITRSCFDVTMGSYDGAEACELVGTFIKTGKHHWQKEYRPLS